jgi:hypothetical protein
VRWRGMVRELVKVRGRGDGGDDEQVGHRLQLSALVLVSVFVALRVNVRGAGAWCERVWDGDGMDVMPCVNLVTCWCEMLEWTTESAEAEVGMSVQEVGIGTLIPGRQCARPTRSDAAASTTRGPRANGVHGEGASAGARPSQTQRSMRQAQ